MCIDDTSPSHLPFGGFSGLLSSSALLSTHLLACSGDCISGFSGLWLLAGIDQGSHKQKAREQEESGSGYFSWPPPCWAPAGWLCAFFRRSMQARLCLQVSVAALSTHPSGLWGLCCRGNNHWYLDSFSQFSLIIHLLFLNYNSVIHWKLCQFIYYSELFRKSDIVSASPEPLDTLFTFTCLFKIMF